MSGAQNVQICLQTYNPDQYKDIQKRYGGTDKESNAKILKVLEGYPDRGKYHGHGSGSANNDSGNNEGAVQNRQNAIKFLQSNAPDQAMEKFEESKDDKSYAVANKSKYIEGPAEAAERIAKEKGNNLGDMAAAYELLFGSKWRDIKKVNTVYQRIQQEKKDKLALKKKK